VVTVNDTGTILDKNNQFDTTILYYFQYKRANIVILLCNLYSHRLSLDLNDEVKIPQICAMLGEFISSVRNINCIASDVFHDSMYDQ